jgi:hypothetical protein
MGERDQRRQQPGGPDPGRESPRSRDSGQAPEPDGAQV